MENFNALLILLDDLPGNVHISGEWLVAALLAIIAWMVRAKTHVWDKHIEECHNKAIQDGLDAGKDEQRLVSLESQTIHTRATLHWIGDCMMVVGTKVGVDLPERPKIND